MRKRCPVCGGTEFITVAHVMQEWLVDECGYCQKVLNDCLEISFDVNDDNIWECKKCGNTSGGRNFNIEE